ncbi:MAG TPA: DUF3362 domain-containing protein, partial [Burkholderiaceae bacterium]|nr:DUF3362 domain-containing protein [Burkholderiaceae bacterium]
RYSKEAGKKQYLIPYFIAAHPGSTDEDMMNLALWLKKNDFKLDQVQTFMPTPMAMATTMYHTRKNPLHKVDADSEIVETARSGQIRKLHKAFLRFHDPANWPLLREGLKRMGRSDLIGNGARHLVPAWSNAEDGGLGGARKRTPDAGKPAVVHAKVVSPATLRASAKAVAKPGRSPAPKPAPARPQQRKGAAGASRSGRK